MQYRFTVLGALALASNSLAAYVPSEPWTTLTPEGSLAGTVTNYEYTFGISISPMTSGTAKVKRDVVTQIADGQIQATTSTASTAAAVVTQIGDGQIQAGTTTKATAAAVVTQIGDGQIQAGTTTKATAAAVVTQIGDGQIQAGTSTKATAAAVVTQIGDGQIQAGTSTKVTAAAVVTQIGDGQIQAGTSTKATAAAVVTQIGDGQIQASTSTNTVAAASQIGDGQVQATNSAAAAALNDKSNPVKAVACHNEGSLSMTLADTVLYDSNGRIGSIVANRQFQFDGPPPQAGAIYAAGWSITADGKLALGNQDIFYQCLSGDFYNLYDESIGGQCHPVQLDVVDLIGC